MFSPIYYNTIRRLGADRGGGGACAGGASEGGRQGAGCRGVPGGRSAAVAPGLHLPPLVLMMRASRVALRLACAENGHKGCSCC